MKINNKKILEDIFLNIVASALPTLLLQFIAFPLIAAKIGDTEKYGTVITVIGIMSIFAGTFGSPLNNTRLIREAEYQKNNEEGDFQLLTLIAGTLCVIGCSTTVLFYQKTLSIIATLRISVACFLLMCCTYYIVGFRLELNYKKVLFNNIIQSIGFLIGILVFISTRNWEWIYILGYSASLAYIFLNSNIMKENIHITPLLKETTHYLLALTISSFLANILIYIDRLLLFPLLGGASVSIYYASTIVGKSTSMIISPLSGVMLSYLSKAQEIKKKAILILLIISILLGVIGYFLSIAVAPYILSILYPELAEKATIYLKINTITALLDVLSMIFSPILIKFRSINWQIGIYSINIIVYVSLAMWLTPLYGLKGYCLSIMFAAMSKLLVMVTVAIYEPNMSR